MQPPQRLHRTRSRRPRLPDLPIRDQRLLAHHPLELAACGLQRKEVRLHTRYNTLYQGSV